MLFPFTMQEDAYWEAHANPKAKRDAKREEQERQREEAAKKKAEAKRLAAQEEAALAAASKKSAPKAAPKVGLAWLPARSPCACVQFCAACLNRPAAPGERPGPPAQMTAHQLAMQRERDLVEQQRLAEQRNLETKRMVSADEYAAALEVENRNRCVAMARDLREFDSCLRAFGRGSHSS